VTYFLIGPLIHYITQWRVKTLRLTACCSVSYLVWATSEVGSGTSWRHGRRRSSARPSRRTTDRPVVSAAAVLSACWSPGASVCSEPPTVTTQRPTISCTGPTYHPWQQRIRYTVRYSVIRYLLFSTGLARRLCASHTGNRSICHLSVSSQIMLHNRSVSPNPTFSTFILLSSTKSRSK